MFRLALFAMFAHVAYGAHSGSEAVKVDPAMKPYTKVEGISGDFKVVGSDTLHDLMVAWTDNFKKTYPGVKIAIESRGSGTAPPALMAGSSQVGPMSRKMTPVEIQEFEKKKGYKPTEIGVALDALAIFVHKDNPIQTLTLDQLDSIFSKTHKRNKSDISSWSQLDPKSPLGTQKISLYSRDENSGTHDYFADTVLQSGAFKDEAKSFADSLELIKAIAADPKGIGYSGIGFEVPGVKTVSLIEKPGKEAKEPTAKNVLNLTYPLGRMLYVYVDRKPGQPFSPLVGEFLKFVLSREGQDLVVEGGFIPVPARAAEINLARLK